MNYISVTTSQNITIDYDVAGVGERIAARILDFAIFFAVYLLFIIIVSSLGLIFNNSGNLTLLVIFGLLFVFYDLLCEVFFNGQSVGKRVLRIKVISLDGYQPSLSQYFLRWLFRFVDFTITMQVGALVCAAVTPSKQRIGDLVAGTTLIKTVPRTSLDAVVFRPQVATEDYDPLFPEVAQLNDRDVTLIHEVIGNFSKSGNNMLVYKMAMKAKDTMGIQIPEEMDELQFLRAIIKDYNYITSRV
ncbi:RDD family protein [Olivibacter sp. SDN3]|uniref:RDD family protein n=1 Tax=Olivibacter sp. SDN3 TaxID=2764720 RepID=UPI0016516492|nr:RDD family protein [Olivibacter sp. SDN3]QNL50659.1 RDD family protein [Olivibacter sp. SDN3]